MLVALDIRIAQIVGSTRLPVLGKTLQNLKRRMINMSEAFINEQVSAVEGMKFTSRKRSGVFPFVTTLPLFIEHMEKSVKHAPKESSTARNVLNQAYERITAAIFGSLDALLREAERSADEKERINASVMNLQNGYHLVSQLTAIPGPAVEASLNLARKRYDNHLHLYAQLSLQRALPRLYDFFDGISATLSNTPAEEVAFHAAYNKASARRVLSAQGIREIRKAIELVHGRVMKHFPVEAHLRQVVWRTCQERFVNDSTEWAEYLKRVYPGSDLQLSYTIADAMALFSDSR